ncbi:MAG: hypothetical protein ACT4QE_22940 [Anaerolineales bacterium]
MYGLIGLAALAGLLASGFAYLVYLAVPAVSVFAWLQSAASIVYAYLRLEQPVLAERPDTVGLFRMAWRALLCCSANVLSVLGLGLAQSVPLALVAPFAFSGKCVVHFAIHRVVVTSAAFSWTSAMRRRSPKQPRAVTAGWLHVQHWSVKPSATG